MNIQCSVCPLLYVLYHIQSFYVYVSNSIFVILCIYSVILQVLYMYFQDMGYIYPSFLLTLWEETGKSGHMTVARFSCLSLGLPTRTMFSLVDFKTLRYMKWGWKSGLSNSWDSRGGQNLPTPLPLWLDKPLHPFYCYVWYILHFTVYTALHIPCF